MEDNPMKKGAEENQINWRILKFNAKNIINLSKLFLVTFMLEYHWQRI